MPMTKEAYLQAVTRVVAQKSTCPRASVGAVFVNSEHEILATGYNGSPSGMPHCEDVGCDMEDGHCERTTHAEQNAIVQAAKRGTPLRDSILYCTHTPCHVCAKLLVTLKVKEIRAAKPYVDNKATTLLATARIPVTYWETLNRLTGNRLTEGHDGTED